MSIRELSVTLNLQTEQPVGTLVQDDRQVFFEFDPSFLSSGRTLSPYALPTRSGLLAHRSKPGVPVPGVFSDSLPDGWGLKLLHRAFAEVGRPRQTVTALDQLAFLGERAMGALSYAPSTGPRALFEAVEIGALAGHARAVFSGDAHDVLPALLRAGGSPGGARPKALVGRSGQEMCVGEAHLPPGFEPWLVKFERPEDDRDAGRREAVWLGLAEQAGITVPPFEVLDLGQAGTALATRRFDRQPRRHLLSAAGALDVDFRTAVVDYTELGKLGLFLTQGDQAQVEELVRRAMFNVVFGNDDDHLKNHAWLYDGERWALSPAYDLTWSPLRARSTPVGGYVHDVPRHALIELGTGLGLPRKRVVQSLETVLEVGARTRRALLQAGCADRVSALAADAVEATVGRIADAPGPA